MNLMLYFLLALTLVIAANADPGDPVLDTEENLIFGGSYYVIPRNDIPGGGLSLSVSGRGGNPCPLDIVQESSHFNNGIPIKFSNWKSHGGEVTTSVNLNIVMDVAATVCVQSTYWRVDEVEKKTGKSFLVAGPKPKGSGEDSLKSFFQIERSDFTDYAYKFMFCPSECTDVEIYVDENGVSRLALSGGSPFWVYFKKATNVTETSSKTM